MYERDLQFLEMEGFWRFPWSVPRLPCELQARFFIKKQEKLHTQHKGNQVRWMTVLKGPVQKYETTRTSLELFGLKVSLIQAWPLLSPNTHVQDMVKAISETSLINNKLMWWLTSVWMYRRSRPRRDEFTQNSFQGWVESIDWLHLHHGIGTSSSEKLVNRLRGC